MIGLESWVLARNPREVIGVLLRDSSQKMQEFAEFNHHWCQLWSLGLGSPRFLHCKVSIFSCIICEHSVVKHFESKQISCVLSNFHPLVSASIDDSCLIQLLLLWLLNGDFLISYFLLHFIVAYYCEELLPHHLPRIYLFVSEWTHRFQFYYIICY